MTSGTDHPDGISLVQLLNILLRRRRLIVAVPLGIAVLLVVVGLLQRRTYTVSATFVPQSANVGPSQLAGLAAQFGVSVGTQRTGESLDFYAALVRSPALQRALVTTDYLVPSGVDTLRGSLIDIFEIEADTPRLAEEQATKQLRRGYGVSTNDRAGLASISVKTHYPELSLAITERALDLINQFNQETRQSQARSERTFIQERLTELATELRDAEDSLGAFLEHNKRFAGSPGLSFAHDRLQRQVVMRQQVYTSLAQGYEQARIDEVRNTPVITVFEVPVIPARPDSRGLAVRGLLALALGSLVAILLAIGLEVFEQSRTESPQEAERLRHLRDEALLDISRPWRKLRGTG